MTVMHTFRLSRGSQALVLAAQFCCVAFLWAMLVKQNEMSQRVECVLRPVVCSVYR